MARTSSFFAGHTLYSRQILVLPFSCTLIFNCFRVVALFDPHQSPIRIKVEETPCSVITQRGKGVKSLIDLSL